MKKEAQKLDTKRNEKLRLLREQLKQIAENKKAEADKLLVLEEEEEKEEK